MRQLAPRSSTLRMTRSSWAQVEVSISSTPVRSRITQEGPEALDRAQDAEERRVLVAERAHEGHHHHPRPQLDDRAKSLSIRSFWRRMVSSCCISTSWLCSRSSARCSAIARFRAASLLWKLSRMGHAVARKALHQEDVLGGEVGARGVQADHDAGCVGKEERGQDRRGHAPELGGDRAPLGDRAQIVDRHGLTLVDPLQDRGRARRKGRAGSSINARETSSPRPRARGRGPARTAAAA